MAAISQPTPPVEVATGPCKDVILRGAEVDLSILPVPTYSEQDPGPFITLGVGITKDAEMGAQNAGIYRMQMFGRTETGLAASPYSDIQAM